jgi:hypothetical protein
VSPLWVASSIGEAGGSVPIVDVAWREMVTWPPHAS